MKSGDEVWHLGYNGPRTVEFVELFPYPHNYEPTKDKAVVLFHGVPEVVDAKDLYDNRAACYRTAAVVAQQSASTFMAKASEYLTAADKSEAESKEDDQ